MSNLGKALLMAGSVLLFAFATSIAIYLYGTITYYLVNLRQYVSIDQRAENTSVSYSSFKRDIDVSEIYLTLKKMDQMHVDKLVLSGLSEISVEQINDTTAMSTFLSKLSSVKDRKFIYSFAYDTNNKLVVTYQLK